jgi:hypothetical protein
MESMPHRVSSFLETLPPDHVAADLEPDDPIIPALDYFLGLEGVPGKASREDRLRTEPIDRRDTNSGKVSWASICAELGATRLIGDQLGLQITGFDQVSPQVRHGTRDCDIRAMVGNTPTDFEVKRHSVDDTRILPDALAEMVSDLGLVSSVELKDTRYRCSDLPALRDHILRHLAKFPNRPRLKLPEMTISFRDQGIANGQANGVCFDWEPASIGDIRSWILETDKVGRNGKPMVPMVKQAEAKGADYLVCRVEGWDSLDEIAEGVFSSTDRISDKTYEASDPKLGRDIMGIILFHRFDSFIVVNNGLTRKRTEVLA